MTGLLCLGDLNLDVTITLADRLAVGSDTSGTIEMHGGGSAANVAAWARHAGADVSFVGVVGDDQAGGFLHDELEQRGISVRTIRRGNTRTRAVAAIIDLAGERSLVSDLGTNLYPTGHDYDASWLSGIGWLHLTGYTFIAEYSRAFFRMITSAAKGRSVPFSIDPSAAHLLSATFEPAEVLAAFDGAAVVFPNRDEAQFLTGLADPRAAAEDLLQLSECAAVKCGAEGAYIAHRELPTFHVAAEEAEIVNTLGAGDAFAGGFLAGLGAGSDVRGAAALAVQTAAHAVQQGPAR